MTKIIHPTFFGNARIIDPGSDTREENEVLFCIHYSNSRKYGFIELSDEMSEVFEKLIDNSLKNRRIQFIKRSSHIQVTFEDGYSISKKSFTLESNEFRDWLETVENSMRAGTTY